MFPMRLEIWSLVIYWSFEHIRSFTTLPFCPGAGHVTNVLVDLQIDNSRFVGIDLILIYSSDPTVIVSNHCLLVYGPLVKHIY